MPQDKVRIQAIKVFGYHGYYQQERTKGNDFEVDLSAIPLQPLHQMDQLADSFDYEKAVEIVKKVFEGPSKLFIEELATDVGHALWNEKQLHSLCVSVRKLNPPVTLQASYSEVRLCWPRPTSP
jgi:dihydroneopterin aldolase